MMEDFVDKMNTKKLIDFGNYFATKAQKRYKPSKMIVDEHT
jgi:hypothetical protein